MTGKSDDLRDEHAPAEGDFILDEVETTSTLPRWVPVLIAAVLVALAALAIYTGIRYRPDTMARIIKPRRLRNASAQAPPGEPEAGASHIFPGDAGDNTPAAHPPVSGSARAVITGNGSAIDATMRIWARRGMAITAEPADAMVYVNDVAIGQASQFSREPYEFPQAGSYNVRVVAPGYQDRTFVITADERARGEIAHVSVKLPRQ